MGVQWRLFYHVHNIEKLAWRDGEITAQTG